MIRHLSTNDLAHAAHIASLAYPGMNIQSEEKRAKFVERLTEDLESDNDLQYFGYFNENDELLGVYRLLDFRMNVNGQFQRVFGIGMVAVHLLHKKEKIAFAMLSHFHQYAREQQVHLVSLYPFNASFYRKMGYGNGPLRFEFAIKPNTLIHGEDKSGVTFLSTSDLDEIVELYDEYAAQNHGMIKRTWRERQHMKNADALYVGVKEDGKLTGAIAFTLSPREGSHFLDHDLIIHEWYWTTVNAYQQLTTWLHSQNDQVNRIIFRTHDDSFIYTVTDPRNESNHIIPSVYHEVATAGSGIMYRITNIEQFVQETNFHGLQRPMNSVSLFIYLHDSFLQEQEGLYNLSYNGKRWHIEKIVGNREDAHLIININDLSSWWMGCVSIESLVLRGIVQLKEFDISTLDHWWKPSKKPLCLTNF